MPREYRSCKVELEFGAGTYTFFLGLKMLAELQAVRKAPIGSIFSRVLKHEEYVEDCLEAIRLGLIGGGIDPIEAKRLLDAHAIDMPHSQRWSIAAAVLMAAFEGYEPKKKGRQSKAATNPSSST